MATQAVFLSSARGQIEVRDHEPGPPGPGEAQVEIEVCGVCHSDLMISTLEQLPLAPLVIGHEGVGRVRATGEGVADLSVGDRVGITYLASTCGICDRCRAGEERFCPRQLQHGYSHHGAMGSIVNVVAQQLARVPPGLAAELAAPLCCAGWTALGAVRGAGLAAGQRLAIFGMGGLGHLAVQYARHLGLQVAAVDVSEAKLEQARALGADLAVPAADAGRAIVKAVGGADAAISFTAAGPAIHEAFRSLRRRGALYLVGMAATARCDLPLNEMIIKGVTVRGSYLGTRADLEEVFALAEAGVGLPHVELHGAADVADIFGRLRAGEIVGRAVIQLG
ncbi:MAG TPA: zinc-binding dehydrogenase [Kofleriaceae bacterium]|nr:zinc-binding dehydrogenase [Kofleriaceae bacterium]